MPFRAERFNQSTYGFKGYKNRFRQQGKSSFPINSAEILLSCMASWTRARVDEVTFLINQAGGNLTILNEMLAIEVDIDKVTDLNKELAEMESQVGLPTIIDPDFRKEEKRTLWKKIYGTDYPM